MRLICGIVQLDGTPASESLLRKMISQMDVPRLRPSIRVWRDGLVALAVLDFSARGSPALPLSELRPDLPVGLRMAVEKALEKDPAERYQTMREMVVDLRRLTRQSGETATAPPPRRARGFQWEPR